MSSEAPPYQHIIFDVDSTLVIFEGLDWLAEQKGVADQVKQLTQLSMDGTVPLESVFAQKMAIISPTQDDMIKLGHHYCQNLTPGAQEVVQILNDLGKQVWILTGNFEPAVMILAQCLGINPDRVLCNSIDFDDNGNYLGFDASGPLSRSGGKPQVIRQNIPSGKSVMIGDGSSDLEARDAVDLFIGFGGVVSRPKVKQNADIFIDVNNLILILDSILPSTSLDISNS